MQAIGTFARYPVIRNRIAGQSKASSLLFSDLLVRHTHHLHDWHLTLPMITFALNTTVHSNTGRTPFFALFGPHPVLIPEFKDADLHQPTL
eukprot:362000-Pleurochrysis_carterae.AAC.1